MRRTSEAERPDASRDAAVIDGAKVPSSVASRVLLAAAGLVVLVFLGLGGWQVVRLQWKLDLIARVDARVTAPVVAAPAARDWPRITAATDEYRHVSTTGRVLYGRTVRVQAVTERGSGFWLLTPLRRADGDVVLINRGFVPARSGDWLPGAGRIPAGAGERAGEITTVTGLLRISEPDGAFLRRNDPAGNRWYSRDVDVIATAVAVGPVAPYFVDADAASAGRLPDAATGDQPVGGLTVIAFHNNHVVYAITWFALALMLAAAVAWNLSWVRRSGRAGALRGNALD